MIPAGADFRSLWSKDEVFNPMAEAICITLQKVVLVVCVWSGRFKYSLLCFTDSNVKPPFDPGPLFHHTNVDLTSP
jgi:hypothetical protein